ncbi:hypothetical protein ASD99_27690 [Mesorhizobium sp. Root695]|uniref:hypothetical protein n=1 Tax=Mesorhizobium sp. Root695 TaxID=1736589 RepID=UPI00070F1517|nr:hypothetical protein [Mesorhizobium sp. Root695]KRB26796.1 hypothetical protein ASD99_27690 [Mesorhizobium sp. Root695]
MRVRPSLLWTLDRKCRGVIALAGLQEFDELIRWANKISVSSIPEGSRAGMTMRKVVKIIAHICLIALATTLLDTPQSEAKGKYLKKLREAQAELARQQALKNGTPLPPENPKKAKRRAALALARERARAGIHIKPDYRLNGSNSSH